MMMEEILALTRPKKINLDSYGTTYEKSIGWAIVASFYKAFNGETPEPITLQDVGTFWEDVNINRPLDVYYSFSPQVLHSFGATVSKAEENGATKANEVAFSGLVAMMANGNPVKIKYDVVIMKIALSAVVITAFDITQMELNA